MTVGQLFKIYNQADSVYNMFIEFSEGTIIVDKLTNEDNYYSVNVSWKSIGYGVDEQYIIGSEISDVYSVLLALGSEISDI